MSLTSRWVSGLAAGVAVWIGAASLHAQQPRQVDDAMLLKPPDGEWITYGRDQAETHHSPLKQIDQSNVARLAVAWSAEVGSEGKIETRPSYSTACCTARQRGRRFMPSTCGPAN